VNLVDVVLHLDVHLLKLVAEYGIWIYAILFAIIFSETGFVVTPFLPGDSLLFVAGAIAASGEMNVHLLFVLLALAAVLGNSVNYAIGRWLGKALLHGRGIALAEPEAPGQGARVLRAPRRQGGGAVALPAHRAHLRAVRGRHGAHDAAPVHDVQRRGGCGLGGARFATPATFSATSRGFAVTSPRSSWESSS
jgi:hypothetical protein